MSVTSGPEPLAAQHTHHPSPLAAAQSVLYLIVIAIFIIAFSAQPFRIPSGSMEPTLLIGDFLLVDKQLVAPASHDPLPATSIHRGDIIVFHYPVEPTLHLVKRVIGLPGDRVRLHEGRVFINGRELVELYAVNRPAGPDSFRDNFPRMESAEPGIESRWWIEMRRRIDHGELIVPAEEYFVLGDNRNNSEDSRYWGFVPRAAIVGKPFLIYFSLRQADRNDSPAAPQFHAPLLPVRTKLSFLERVTHFARWDRTLHIIY